MNVNTPQFWDQQFKEEFDNWVANTGFQRWQAPRFETISLLLPMKGIVLDIGCGLGHYCRYLGARRPFAYQLHGMDFSAYAVKKAAELDYRAAYNVGDVYALPYTDQMFDVVVAQEVIEHLDKVDLFLAEIARVGKKGATVLISTPERQSPDINAVCSDDHVHEFTPNELMATMMKICTEVDVRKIMPLYDPVEGELIHDKTLICKGVLK